MRNAGYWKELRSRMRLDADTRLGPYRVVAGIGAGGMGEVYRAQDTILRRDVAVKVLRRSVAADPARVARLEREAQTLAALNHPNIAHIYGLEEQDGERLLIMEYIDGSTLADRIALGPVPVDEALEIAGQIANGLEAAHDVGIVHRDLKPANVMLKSDGTVKLLDFGIAKALRSDGDLQAPQPNPLTEAGDVLGTTAYMSPEQSRGRSVDRRTDVWAFACVLYEMLTGQPAFGGEDGTVTLARVLERDVDLSALPGSVPESVRRTIRLCLEKDPALRMRDIGDVRLSLGGAFDRESSPSGSSGRLLPVLGIVAVAAVTAVWIWADRVETALPEGPLMRFSVDLGDSDRLGPTTAISPDGTRIVYRARSGNGPPQLATRLLSETDETLLDGTAGAYNPSFSPDGQWVSFMRVNRLMKTPAAGGVPIALADAAIGRIGSWGDDGFIYAELNPFSGIFRVSDEGGTVEQLTQSRLYRHAWPQALPDGRVLYTAGLAGLLDNGRIELLDPGTGETRVVLEGGYMARYIASGETTGHLLFVRGGVLYAVAFDLDTLQVRGERIQLAVDVASTGADLGNAFDVAANGTVVYSTGSAPQRWRIDWLDGDGNRQPLLATPRAYYTPRISPDGLRVAYSVEDERGQDVFVYDIEREITTRLTVDSAANLWPVWAPDGEHLAYTSLTEERAALWWIRADGTGAPQLLLERDNPVRQIMLSPDGARLGFTEQDPETGSDLWVLPLDLMDPDAPLAGDPIPFVRTPFNEGVPAFSSDGRWIAYLSDELGGYEVWVQPFPGPGGRWQVSNGIGGYPFWSETENALFYMGRDTVMRVEYTIEGERFVPGTPRQWGRIETVPAPVGFETLDLAPDGRRFAVFSRLAESAAEPGRVTFLVNAFDEVRRRAPPSR